MFRTCPPEFTIVRYKDNIYYSKPKCFSYCIFNKNDKYIYKKLYYI